MYLFLTFIVIIICIVLKGNKMHFFNFRVQLRTNCENTVTFLSYGIRTMTKTISFFMRRVKAYQDKTIVYIPEKYYSNEMKLLIERNSDVFNEIKLFDLCDDDNKIFRKDVNNLPNNKKYNLVFIGQKCVEKVFSHINDCQPCFNKIKYMFFSSQYHVSYRDSEIDPTTYEVYYYIFINSILKAF